MIIKKENFEIKKTPEYEYIHSHFPSGFWDPEPFVMFETCNSLLEMAQLTLNAESNRFSVDDRVRRIVVREFPVILNVLKKLLGSGFKMVLDSEEETYALEILNNICEGDAVDNVDEIIDLILITTTMLDRAGMFIK